MSSLRRAPGALALLLAPVLLGVAACDTGDGRSLDAPPPGATAPPLPTSTTTTAAPVLGTAGDATTTGPLLSSSAFLPGTAIPERHASCGGGDLSPPLSWTGVPAGTVELALTVVDPDAPGAPFVHWVVTGIDPVVGGFGEGGVPEGAVEARPWTGPCPLPGETHQYVFTLYAFTVATGVTSESSPDEALAALETTPGFSGTLVGTFGTPGG